MKFIHVTKQMAEDPNSSAIVKTGYSCWAKAFNGTTIQYDKCKDMLDGFDVIMVAISKSESDGMIIDKIRDRIGYGRHTKIIGVIDWACEAWSGLFIPELLEQQLNKCDLIIISSKSLEGAVKSMVGLSVPIANIIHPVDFNTIRDTVKWRDKRDAILTMVHYYDNDWYWPYMATRNLPYDNHYVFMNNDVESAKPFVTYFVSMSAHKNFLEFMTHYHVVLDSYHYVHSMGRLQLDAATLGIPCVGTNIVASQGDLYPKLTTEPYDANGQKILINKLFKDRDFRDECIMYAHNRVRELYSLEAKQKELMKYLEVINEKVKIQGNTDIHGNDKVDSREGIHTVR